MSSKSNFSLNSKFLFCCHITHKKENSHRRRYFLSILQTRADKAAPRQALYKQWIVPVFVPGLIGHTLRTLGPFDRLLFVGRDYVAIYLIILVLFNTFY